jgi:hypothetical protein
MLWRWKNFQSRRCRVVSQAAAFAPFSQNSVSAEVGLVHLSENANRGRNRVPVLVHVNERRANRREARRLLLRCFDGQLVVSFRWLGAAWSVGGHQPTSTSTNEGSLASCAMRSPFE